SSIRNLRLTYRSCLKNQRARQRVALPEQLQRSGHNLLWGNLEAELIDRALEEVARVAGVDLRKSRARVVRGPLWSLRRPSALLDVTHRNVNDVRMSMVGTTGSVDTNEW
ncbi:MAG TPA: hypothetical protein VLA19_05030, partial [Herpetosiphonaceae bacterium]|nr:hypothetical protein [Herpetosiphonaceae bacterium]